MANTARGGEGVTDQLAQLDNGLAVLSQNCIPHNTPTPSLVSDPLLEAVAIIILERNIITRQEVEEVTMATPIYSRSLTFVD